MWLAELGLSVTLSWVSMACKQKCYSAPPLPGVVFRLSRLKWRFPTIWLCIRVDWDFIVRDLQCVPSLASLLGFVWLWQATGSVLTSVSWLHHVAPACLPEEPAAEGSQGWGCGRLARGSRLGQTVKMKKSVLFHSRFFFPAKHIIVATPAISMLSSGWSTADPRQLCGRQLWEWSLRPSFATYYVTLRKVLVKMIVRAKWDTMLYAVWGAAFSVTSLNVAANTEMTDGQPVLP